MMFTRRILAALLVAVPTMAVGIVVMQWMPLPNPLNVQWSGTEVSSTQPLWMVFLPLAALTLGGFALAIAAIVDRDHEEPFRGTLDIAVLTSGSAGACSALLAMNLGYAAPTGPAFLGALALAPVYALLPLAVVGIHARHRSSIDQDKAENVT